MTYNMTFRRFETESDDDPGWELVTEHGFWIGISIQDSTSTGCGYTVLVYGDECPNSPLPGDFFVEGIGVYAELPEAEKAALDFFESVKEAVEHMDPTPYIQAINQAHRERFDEAPEEVYVWTVEGEPVNPAYHEVDSYNSDHSRRTRWAVTDGKVEHLYDAPGDETAFPPGYQHG